MKKKHIKTIISFFKGRRKKKRILPLASETPRILKSRQVFAKQIAATIKLNTENPGKDSFILGISGKWGEGKTSLLDELEVELRTNYRVVKINPWGVGTDQVTFLRNFIKELNTQLKSDRKIINVWHNFLRKKELDEMYFDITKTKISLLYLFLTIVVLSILLVIYVFFAPNISFLLPTKVSKGSLAYAIGFVVLISSILAPILTSVLSKIFTTQQGSKSISTIDSFKDLLRKILKGVKNEKIIVFVDDLDRVTPEMARIVLDNLRVFFDEPQLSFIVTGDHSVLERYLGMQTLPDQPDANQLEEGRRYLKKIFNVYWRMPLVIKSELKTFIDHQISTRKTDLDEIFDTNQLTTLKEYLEKYFESNFRQIIRFIDTVLFTFSLIKTQKEGTQGDEKAYFEEMTKEPLLVVRILMIQELCSPLFESIIKDNETLFNIEYAVDKKDLGKVSSILQPLGLTISQTTFINKFILEEPRFFNDNVLKVTSLSPFLNLAADTSFGDARGASPEDFIAKIQSGDGNQVKSSLIGSGKEKITKAAIAFNELVTGNGDPIQKSTYLQTLLSALAVIPQEHISQNVFSTSLSRLDLAYLDSQGPARMNIYKMFWAWLDSQKQDISEGSSYVGKFTFLNASNFTDSIPSNPNWFSTKVICSWLKTYYSQDRINAVNKMSEILPQLPKEIVKKELDSLSDDLVNGLINEGNVSYRDTIMNILLQYTLTGKNKLQTRLLQEASRLNIDIWNWTDAKINAMPDFLDRNTLEQRVVDYLNAVAPPQILVDAMNFASGRVNNLQEAFWEKVLEKHLSNFVDSITTFMGQSLTTTFAPSNKAAIKLFKLLLKETMETNDEVKKNNIIDYLKKRWIWGNILELPDIAKIRKWYIQETNGAIKEKIRQLLESWGLPLEETIS